MRWLIWALLLPGCLTVAAILAQRAYCQVFRVFLADRARARFRLQREWLEVEFLEALGRLDPEQRARWDEAQWQDPVVWARDRQTGRLLALIGVHFEPAFSFESAAELPAGSATVVFEYQGGRWRTDGKRLEAIDPDGALQLRPGQYERLALPEHPG